LKLTLHQKSFVYELLSLSKSTSVIIDAVKKKYGDKPKPFGTNHLAFYRSKWKAMIPEERMQYLPYTMEDSFANQDVRINDDIKQLELLDERIYIEENSKEPNNQTIVELLGMSVRLKNRIAQELGQARAFAKGGVGNMNQVQIQLNQFNTLVSKVGSQKSPEERLKSLNKIYEAIDNADKSGKE